MHVCCIELLAYHTMLYEVENEGKREKERRAGLLGELH